MKVLFNCSTPFMLAHGGVQIQIERTKAGLEALGVEVEWLRWWDDTQTADVLHQFSGPSCYLVSLAHGKGWKVVTTLLLTETCNRPAWQLLARKILLRSMLAAPFPQSIKVQLPWRAFQMCDRMIVGLEAERRIITDIYGVPRNRTEVVPLGLSEDFLQAKRASRESEYLICTGTIGPSKNSVELARMALAAQTPILFVGSPHDFTSDYWREFKGLIDGKIVKNVPHVKSRAELISLLQKARGYALMSRFENWSLAAHEAAACGLPALLPDQRWSRERFGSEAAYFPKRGGGAAIAVLRRFYDQCPGLRPPQIKLYSWTETAERIRKIYADICPGRA
jgi:glycosyltransferase involved in cell wall biosynthesis